jgi:hypothetical protein
MKITCLIILLFFCFSSFAQLDSTRTPFNFGVQMSLGHLKRDYTPGDKNISSRLYAPQIEMGRALKLNLGFIFLQTDSINVVDTFEQRFARLAVGFSFKEYLGTSNLYAQGGYSLLLGDSNMGPQIDGHVITLEFGRKMPRINADLFLSTGRLFDKEQLYSGTIFKFGIRLFKEL